MVTTRHARLGTALLERPAILHGLVRSLDGRATRAPPIGMQLKRALQPRPVSFAKGKQLHQGVSHLQGRPLW